MGLSCLHWVVETRQDGVVEHGHLDHAGQGPGDGGG